MFRVVSLVVLLASLAHGQNSTQEENNSTYTLSLPAYEPVTLPCAALGEVVERGLHDEGEVISVWVSPVGQMVLPTTHLIDYEKYDACAEGREEQDAPLNKKLLLFDEEDHLAVLPNGSLRIDHVGWADRGDFRCILLGLNGSYTTPLVTWDSPPAASLHLEHEYRSYVYYFSILWGVVTAVGFFLVTLFIKFMCYVLETYGCCLCCCCCKNQLPPKARKMKVALDSIETYRQQQHDKLRENYTQQSEWIRQNCASQMERVRENYQSQSQNIKELKQYGSAQIGAVREQYFDQMQRIRDYSTGQLDRVHENYIFQRQRLRKFSAANYLKMRETGKHTGKTLSKVMENLPPLYLDLSNCRAQDDQPDLDFSDLPAIAELDQMDEEELREKFSRLGVEQFLQGRFREASAVEEGGSLYFTPAGTPLRESAPGKARSQKNLKSSSLKSTPTREQDLYRSVYQCHKKSSSFSHFLPSKWFGAGAAAAAAAEAAAVMGPPQCAAAPNKQQQYHVRAIIEHENKSGDYIDISSSDATMASEDPGTASTSVSVIRAPDSAASSSGRRSSEDAQSDEQTGLLAAEDTLTAVVTRGGGVEVTLSGGAGGRGDEDPVTERTSMLSPKEAFSGNESAV